MFNRTLKNETTKINCKLGVIKKARLLQELLNNLQVKNPSVHHT